MKSIILLGIILMFLFNSTSAVERLDLQTYPIISSKNVAVFLIDFPDIPQNIKAQFPTVAEAQDYFVDGLVKDFFTSISYDKLQFSGKVFGYYTMPDSLTKERQNNEFIIETTENYDLKIDCLKPKLLILWSLLFFIMNMNREGFLLLVSQITR